MSTKPSILVLDDDPEWFGFIKESLGDAYDLVHAKDLKEAEQWLQAKNFRLAIVDLNLEDEIMPEDRSGYNLIEDLDRMEIMRDMSIIVLSRWDDAEELRTAFKKFHVFDFISKRKFTEIPFGEIVSEAVAASYGGTKNHID